MFDFMTGIRSSAFAQFARLRPDSSLLFLALQAVDIDTVNYFAGLNDEQTMPAQVAGCVDSQGRLAPYHTIPYHTMLYRMAPTFQRTFEPCYTPTNVPNLNLNRNACLPMGV